MPRGGAKKEPPRPREMRIEKLLVSAWPLECPIGLRFTACLADVNEEWVFDFHSLEQVDWLIAALEKHRHRVWQDEGPLSFGAIERKA